MKAGGHRQKVRQAQAGTATGGKVGQVQQVGAKGGKMHHGAGAAGGHGQGQEDVPWHKHSRHSQGQESKHFVAVAYVDIAHCGIGMARAGW